MASKLALAKRITADFHGPVVATAAESEWRRVHQERRAPSDAHVVRVAKGSYRLHELVATVGLAKSKSDAVRLVKQRAVRRDGVVLEGVVLVEVGPGSSFVLQVGPARFVRVEAEL